MSQVETNESKGLPRRRRSKLASPEELPFTLRFEARCKLCDFTTGLDVRLDDQNASAEVVAVAAVLHAENEHGKKPSLRIVTRKQ